MVLIVASDIVELKIFIKFANPQDKLKKSVAMTESRILTWHRNETRSFAIADLI